MFSCEGCDDCRHRCWCWDCNCGSGIFGTMNIVADNKAYTAGGAVRERCPSVPHPRFEWTEAEHELRYVLSSVRYSRFGGP